MMVAAIQQPLPGQNWPRPCLPVNLTGNGLTRVNWMFQDLKGRQFIWQLFICQMAPIRKPGRLMIF